MYVDVDYLFEIHLGALLGDGYVDNDLAIARVGYVHRWIHPGRASHDRWATTIRIRAGGLIGVDRQRSDVAANEDVRAFVCFGAPLPIGRFGFDLGPWPPPRPSGL